jgi:tetratricopeptide (TPR) repeat protein
MVEDTEKRPGWAESPLYEQAVAHFEAEEWEDAISLFSQLAAEFPEDQELKQILADLRLKASLPRGEDRRGRILLRMRRLGRAVLLVMAAVALIAILTGVPYAIYTNWLLPARAQLGQDARRRESHELARGYLAAGDYARVADLYGEILSQWPDDETAAAGLERAEQLQELAEAYDRAREFTQEEKWYEALWAWRTICATDCNFKDVRYWLTFVEQQDVLFSLFTEAEARYRLQDWSGAIEVLERLRAKNANYRRDEVEALLVSSLVNLAEQMVSDATDPANVYDEVMELFDRAIQIRPQDESVLAERAVAGAYSQSFARFQEEGCEGAQQQLQSVYSDELRGAAGQQFGMIYQANIYCGDELVQARDFQGARACYQAAMELPVDDPSEVNSKYAALVPLLTPTPTPTPRPPSPTPTRRPVAPTPTATVSPWRYVQLGATEYRSNDKNTAGCSWLGVGGQVLDTAGNGVSGVSVRVWSVGWEGHTGVSGQMPAYGSGGWEVPLDDHPKNGVWDCQVVDQNGAGLSPVVVFQTYAGACNANLVLIKFKKTS